MTVLDNDRARNVGVLMRSLKMDARGIEAALHATLFNAGSSGQRFLEEFEIEGIFAAFPTPAEERKLKCMGYVTLSPVGVSYLVPSVHLDNVVLRLIVVCKHKNRSMHHTSMICLACIYQWCQDAFFASSCHQN